MSGRSKEFTQATQAAARQILQASGADITEIVTILPLAKLLMQQTGCNVDTAKVHIARAIRLARGEWVKAQHGGRREGSGFPAGTKRAGRRGKALAT